MHLAPLIQDLAVILAVGAVVSFIFQRIRQPVVLGYLIAGIIVGPHTPPYQFINDLPNIQIWAEIGVIFLMFSLGLEFSFRRLAQVGVTASVSAIFEVAFMMILGFLAGRLIGWTKMDSLFLGSMLSISSTTIIIKALDDLKLKTHRFAEIIFGILIVEDLFAILLLVALSTFATGADISGVLLLTSAGKLVLVIGSWFLVGYWLVPRFVTKISRLRNDETLTIFAIGICFLLVSVAAHFGYSVALGAFIMGSILAETVEAHKIEELIRPLKSVFAAVFFVSVGMLMDPKSLIDNWSAIILITFITIFGKILSTGLGALVTGQSVKTSVQVGFGLAQIGEFSFIIATLGLSLKVMSPELYPIAVAVSLITTFTTPYLIRLSGGFAQSIETRLPREFKEVLQRYRLWWDHSNAETEKKRLLYRALFTWTTNGLIITLIFGAFADLVSDFITPFLPDPDWVYLVCWLGAVLLSAPFIWSMMVTFRKVRNRTSNSPQSFAGTVFFSRLLTIIWIGILSLEYFTLQYTFALTLALSIFLVVFFYRQLEASYKWFESSFLKTFEEKDRDSEKSQSWHNLVPWDAHLVRLQVHPNSEVAGRTIISLELRNKYGVNIIALQRGQIEIIAPKPELQIFPGDELFVLATDEQIDTVRPLIEKENSEAAPSREYHLTSFQITQNHEFSRKTIRQSQIRDKLNSIVVGIERAGQRIMSPDSDLQLEPGDVIWVVGPKEKLTQL